MDATTHERFLSKIIYVNDCWIWKGATDGKGYGVLRVYGRTFKAHRLSYEHYKGELNPELTIDHLREEGICTATLCVNPEHLVQISRSHNAMKKEGATLTHFKCGHPRVPPYVNPNPSIRGCYPCMLDRQVLRYADRKLKS